MKLIHTPLVNLVWATPDPRRVIAIAARMTYSRKPVEDLASALTEEEVKASVTAILERHHFSVLRHISFCFTVSGVSRAFSHQLVRHTAGHSYEQRSQHYRTEKDPAFIEPDSVALTPTAHTLFQDAAQTLEDFYEALIAAGIPRDDARFILPNATETQLIWTANGEAMVNFIKTRACRVNTPEIMAVAVATRRLIIPLIPEIAPHLGPTCLTQGMCFEGDKFYKQCNRPWKSPSVLWRPSFPKTIELIGIGGKYDKEKS